MLLGPFLYLYWSLKGCTAPVRQGYIFIRCSPAGNISGTTDAEIALLSHKTRAVLLSGTPKQKTTHESQQQKKLPLFKWVLNLPYWRSSVHEFLLVDVFLFLLTWNTEHGPAAGLIWATAVLTCTMLAVVLTDVCSWSDKSHSKKH